MATIKKTTNAFKNNLQGPAQGATVESLTHPFSRVDFGIHWLGADGAFSYSGSFGPEVWLYQSLSINAFGNVGGTPEIGVRWTNGTNPGTVKETIYKSINVGIVSVGEAVVLERDNIDPGFGSIRVQDGGAADAGRPGPRYTFMLAAAEYRIYRNYQAVLSQPPLCVIPAPSGGFPFPMGLLMTPTLNTVVRNVIIGAAAQLSSVYSLREQIRDFRKSAAVDATTNVVTISSHGYVDTTPVYVEAETFPGGLSANTVYYVRDATTNTFKLAATSGGAAIDITSNGTNVFVAARQDSFHLRIYQNAKFTTVTKGLPIDVDETIV